jgi:cobalt transporter subunit CbtB
LETGTAAGGAAKEALLNTQTSTTAGVRGSERSEALVAALLAFALGIGLVFTTGFAHPSTIHNAAHDTRHALSFPCH